MEIDIKAESTTTTETKRYHPLQQQPVSCETYLINCSSKSKNHIKVYTRVSKIGSKQGYSYVKKKYKNEERAQDKKEIRFLVKKQSEQSFSDEESPSWKSAGLSNDFFSKFSFSDSEINKIGCPSKEQGVSVTTTTGFNKPSPHKYLYPTPLPAFSMEDSFPPIEL